MKRTFLNSLLISLALYSKMVSGQLSRIKDFEIKYFKSTRKKAGIFELDIGIPDSESMWLAATGDLNGNRK